MLVDDLRPWCLLSGAKDKKAPSKKSMNLQPAAATVALRQQYSSIFSVEVQALRRTVLTTGHKSCEQNTEQKNLRKKKSRAEKMVLESPIKHPAVSRSPQLSCASPCPLLQPIDSFAPHAQCSCCRQHEESSILTVWP